MKNRNKWGFQLLPNTPNVLGVGYRVDPVTQELEDDVDNALPYHFRFHKIKKLVIRLGLKDGEQDYFESNGVAQKYFPDFDIHNYKSLSEEEKRREIKRIILIVFKWLIDEFDDAECFEIARQKLKWELR